MLITFVHNTWSYLKVVLMVRNKGKDVSSNLIGLIQILAVV